MVPLHMNIGLVPEALRSRLEFTRKRPQAMVTEAAWQTVLNTTGGPWRCRCD